jgi:hypothetical protein
MGGSDLETVAFGNITDRRSRRATELQTFALNEQQKYKSKA